MLNQRPPVKLPTMLSKNFELRCAPALLLLAIASVCGVAPALQAAVGDPLAIHTWLGGAVSLETHWDFEVMVDLPDWPSN